MKKRGHASMTVILGIDAAWTEKQPSGVALVRGNGSDWECVAVAPSYESFITLADEKPVDWTRKPAGGKPDVEALLKAAEKILKVTQVDVVAVDMPLATHLGEYPIRERRVADGEISRKFGKYGCAVHSPIPERPGERAKIVYEGFIKKGFSLATKGNQKVNHKVLLEVYPHTALLKLMNASYRVPYKISKI